MDFSHVASGPPLSDRFGRRIQYLRLSVTDRCDMKCTYCSPEVDDAHVEKAEICTLEELLRIVSIFRAVGVTTVRVTGGEPLVRKGVIDLISAIRTDVGITDIALTTNGTLLAAMAPALARAGVRRLNLSLDSLVPEKFAAITRGGDLRRVLAGFDAARDAAIAELKINTVCVKSVNDDELGALCDFAWDRGATPRFIEVMPIGAGAELYRTNFIGVNDIIERLGDRVMRATKERPEGRGPAQYLRSAQNPSQRVGFISATSENFCDGCNRVRVSAKGELRPCLASPQGLSIRDLMRAGAPDDEIVDGLRGALMAKDVGHHFADAESPLHLRVAMRGIGG